MLLRFFLLISTIFFLSGCGGGIVNQPIAEEDKYLPNQLTNSDLVNIDSYNNQDIAKEVLYNLFSDDSYYSKNQDNLALARVVKPLNKSLRIYDDNQNSYTDNFCSQGSYKKTQIDDVSFRFDFYHCKKRGTNTYIDGQMIVSAINTNSYSISFNNYKESSNNSLKFIKSGVITKDSDADSVFDIDVQNLYAYFREGNKREAYYNLNLTKYFYSENERGYSVDGYVYLNKFNGYVKVKTKDNLYMDNKSINMATQIDGEILIGDSIDIIFTNDSVEYSYNGYKSYYYISEFFN